MLSGLGMTQQAERVLHQEVTLRLTMAERAGRLRAVWHSPPNGMYIPARTVAERTLVARLIKQMKDRGQLTPGVPDICLAWSTGSGFIELKRAAGKTLFGRVPAGRLSEAQIVFRDKCAALSINWIEASSWEEVEAALQRWGVIA